MKAIRRAVVAGCRERKTLDAVAAGEAGHRLCLSAASSTRVAIEST
jgi:hypothetical protein